MKKSIWMLLLLISNVVLAQEASEKSESSGLGDGLNFSLNEGDYAFKISGFIQPTIQYSEKTNEISQKLLRSKRTYLNFSGLALKEKLKFFVQADFSAATPLLDAWVSFQPSNSWVLSAGQRRTFTNNREMTFDEDKLQFADRSTLSTSFAGNGREFGVFLEGKLGKKVIFAPQFAITSGDGPNSFGVNATDIDYGGLKYGGRLDFYPLGDFTEGNRGFASDLKHEKTPKILLGVSGSLNKGASNAKGEGHGDFLLYNSDTVTKLPDLRKFGFDILLKYQGFSILSEFVNTSAGQLTGLFVDPNASFLLKPGQISNFLVLGNAWNIQAGYASKYGYALDFRYEKGSPEFSDQTASLLQRFETSTIGLSKYFKGQNLKIQSSLSRIRYVNGIQALNVELMFQVVF